MDKLDMLHQKLKQLRSEKNASLEDVAKMTGISKSLMSKYERGLVEPGLKALMKIALYYHVSLDWLFGFMDDKYDPLAGLSDENKAAAISYIEYLKSKNKS